MGYRYKKKFNKYEFMEDYVVGYTENKEPFYFDKEDFELVTKDNYYWFIENGYIRTRHRIKNSRYRISMHRLILSVGDNIFIDHIDRNRNNNRKNNLRICTKSTNSMNSGKPKNNTSGVKGVVKHQSGYMAHIGYQGKSLYLGYFKNIEDAKKARIEAEIKYFGEFSYKERE